LTHTRARGDAWEARAATWLEARGWEIVDRNFNAPGGELDLVARQGELLAFVEVRGRADARAGHPAETISATKRRRVVTAARHWLARYGDQGCDLRFDVLTLVGPPEAAEVCHFEGAFEAEA